MRIGFFVNDVATEKPNYTTTRLALAASNRGHEVWLISAGDFTYDADESIKAWARAAVNSKYGSGTTYLAAVRGEKAQVKRITVDDLDVLMLRNNPAVETGHRSWAQTAGIIFGRVAMRRGLIVLNDPNALAGALDKMYIQLLPEEIRPRTVITRDRTEIKAFIEAVGGNALLKNLQGTASETIFQVTPNNRANLNQIVEAITRDGYAVAQEFLAAAESGTTRLFLLNGEPLRYKNKYAAFRWQRSEEAMHADIHASGTAEPVKLGAVDFSIAEAVRPRLVQDGIFLAGLHIVGGKLVDIDVFSPGGLGNAQTFEKVNFSEAVIIALERKVGYMGYYRRNFDNVDMATL